MNAVMDDHICTGTFKASKDPAALILRPAVVLIADENIIPPAGPDRIFEVAEDTRVIVAHDVHLPGPPGVV